MTVILGIVTEEYSILMADTRICFEKGETDNYNDGAIKLKPLNYPHGWFAGAGYSTYISDYYDLVSGCLNATQQQYLDAMPQVINRLVDLNPNCLGDILTSTLFRTYINNGELALDVFYVDPNTNSTMAMTYPKNTVLLNLPSGYTAEMTEDLKSTFGIDEIQTGSFSDNFVKLLSMFKLISGNSYGVSEICEVGILKKEGLIKKYSISGTIIELLESNITLSLI